MIFNRGSVKTAGINLQIEDGGITMRFTDDGVPNMVGGLEVGAANAMTSMKHRIRALGGTVELLRTGAAGTILEAYMPLPKGPEIWLRSDDIQRAESSHHCRLGSFFRPFWASKMPVSMVDGY